MLNKATKVSVIASWLLLCIAFTAFGQHKSNKQTKPNKMNLSAITNGTAKKAIEAWQSGDAKSFIALFTSDAKLFDDGNPRDFNKFVKDACGHERFTGIDKVENNGLHIYGNFHTESWGDFKTYFKFHLNAEGKIYRLDIGQAE